MNDVELTRSSSYYSDLCSKKEQQMVDEPDLTHISQCNIDRLVFHGNNHARQAFGLNFCCGEKRQLDRSLLVVLIHVLVVLCLVLFCITFLTLCEADNRFASSILALLSAGLGHNLLTPKQ